MERLIHDDDLGRAVAPGLAPLAADLDGALSRLGAAVAEKNPGHTRLFEDDVGEIELGDRVEVVRDMQQRLGLLLDRLDDSRVAVTEVVGSDASDEVEVLVALVVPDPGALAAHQRDGQTARRHHEYGGLALSGGGHGRHSGYADRTFNRFRLRERSVRVYAVGSA